MIDIVPVIIRDNNDIKIIKHSTQLNVHITILILFTVARDHRRRRYDIKIGTY